MAKPNYNVVAIWTSKEIKHPDWSPLFEICKDAVKNNLPTWGEDEQLELVEDYLPHVSSTLRDIIALAVQNGEVRTFEIDDEDPPYVKSLGVDEDEIQDLLNAIDPFLFEEYCALILKELGAKRTLVTPRSCDGGVDFFGFEFPNFSDKRLPVPICSKALVVGQAKRYRYEGKRHLVTEREIREFIGGASLQVELLRREVKIYTSTPVIYAIWTTSDFDMNAKKYATDMGLWFMNGRTLCEYTRTLGIKENLIGLVEQSGEFEG